MIEQPSFLFAETKTFFTPEPTLAKKADVVVVADAKGETLPANERELLFKIMASVKIEEDDIAIVYTHDLKHSVALLKKHFSASKIIVFSTSANALGDNLRLPLYTLTNISGLQALRAAPLEKVMTQAEHKSVLWKNLKVMFGV